MLEPFCNYSFCLGKNIYSFVINISIMNLILSVEKLSLPLDTIFLNSNFFIYIRQIVVIDFQMLYFINLCFYKHYIFKSVCFILSSLLYLCFIKAGNITPTRKRQYVNS